jgi:hypothetical protein
MSRRSTIRRHASQSCSKEKHALEARIREVENHRQARERYELHAIRPSPAAYVYKLRDEFARTEAPHYVCQTCYDKGTKAVLMEVRTASMGHRWRCPECKRDIVLADAGPLNYGASGIV